MFSIFVSFTNKHVNHTVIFELKKPKKKKQKQKNNYKMDELGVKLTGPVSPWNLDSGKSNVPGYTTETHGPLLTSSILIFFIGICISQNPILRRRLSSGSPMNNDVIFHERIVFLHITLFSQCLSKTTKMSPWRSNSKRQKCRFGAERVKWLFYSLIIFVFRQIEKNYWFQYFNK